MKILGIIAEFNPFHNGHKYLISQAREKSGCDFVVVAMSGDFVQRGAPAIMDKLSRVSMALDNGVDLVVGLPVIASTASASDFALSGIAHLAACGVTTLAFGCEHLELELFNQIADLLLSEPASYKELLFTYLKEGDSYPLARVKALAQFFHKDDLTEILKAPNNILALEYIKAIKQLNVPMELCPIQRVKVDYHSLQTQEEFASASAIRSMLFSEDILSSVSEALHYLPENCKEEFTSYFHRHSPLHEDDFSSLIKYQLLSKKQLGIQNYFDGSIDLSNHIYRNLKDMGQLTDFLSRLKTRDCTYARLARVLFHVLLEITSNDRTLLESINFVPYLRILGFKKEQPLLGYVKTYAQEACSVPIILSVRDFEKTYKNDSILRFFYQDLFARELYQSLLLEKNRTFLGSSSTIENDYRKPFITK